MAQDKTTELVGKPLAAAAAPDAIHIAVCSAYSDEALAPGAHVGLVHWDPAGSLAKVGTKSERLNAGRQEEFLLATIGIVDPFLRVPVLRGTKFFVFLYPLTITGLRHQWTHQAFEAAPAPPMDAITASRQWIREFAAGIDYTYERLMRVAADFVEDDESTLDNDLEGVNADWPAFWKHYAIVRGEAPIPESRQYAPFYCAC